MVKRTILITGGLGGIGMAVARAFAPEGANLLLVDRHTDEASCRALEALGAAQAIGLAADMGDAGDIEDIAKLAMERFGAIDVVVNVAGIMIYKAIADLEAQDWQRVFAVNLLGAALLTGHAFRHMRPGSSIVNIASVHARRTSPLVAPYAAAKAALVSFTRSAAIEGREKGIRVNAILPGAIDTPMLRESPNIKSGAEVIDPDDIGQPEDIAALAHFLASDAACFITGEDIVADGGRMGRL